MSTEALGSQNVSISYDDLATTQTFNKINHKVIKEGLYDGGELSHLSGVISLNPFVSSFRTTTGEAVNVTTSSIITSDTSLPASDTNPFGDISEVEPYLVGNFTWENSVRYVDFSTKASGAIFNNDVVFGKALFSGGIVNDFEYTEKTFGSHDQNHNSYQNATTIITNKDIPTLTSGLVITSDIENVSGDLKIVAYLDGAKAYIPIEFA